MYADAPIIRCDNIGTPITSLNVVVPFTAVTLRGRETIYNVFFVDEHHQIASQKVIMRISGGCKAECRLMLHAGASKKKRIWLAVQDQRDAQDELQMLIPFEFKNLYYADFRL